MVSKNKVKEEVKDFSEKVKESSKGLWKSFLEKARHFNICDFYIGKTEIKISKHGKNTIYFVMILCFVSLLCTGLGFLTTSLLFLILFVLWTFRDPDRVIPNKKNIVVSPADGVVVRMETSSLPSELAVDDKDEYTKISILLRATDVHLQRVPVKSIVNKVEYIKGAFINASLDKASKDNERNIVLFERNNGDKICVVQIAGLISRRIVCEVKKEENCEIGEKYGMIKLGSRVEVYLPKKYKLDILEGQRVVGGETILASFEK